MFPQHRRALIAFSAAVVVCLAPGRPAAQVDRGDKTGAIALLDRYARGDFDAVVAVLEATDKKDFGGLRDALKNDAPAWIASGDAADRRRRELAAATFALEAARAAEWLDWKIVQGSKQISEVRVLYGDVKVGGDGFKNADLLYWQPAPQILEWGCALARGASWPADSERLWQLAALAVAERAEDYEFLVGSPFAARGNAADEFEHLKHATAKLPGERRFALAQAIALEWRSFPENVKGQASRRPGVKEAQTAFEKLQDDEVVGAEATLRLGALRLRTGGVDPALKLFATVEAKTRDPFLVYLARYFRGQALERKQQWADAEAADRGALTAIPRAQSASMALAALVAKRGGRAEAEAIVAASLSARPQPVDPWRAYGDGDDRFWPELIAALRQAIAGAQTRSPTGSEPFSTEKAQKGSEPFSTDSAEKGSDPKRAFSVEKGSDPLRTPLRTNPLGTPFQDPVQVFRTDTDLVTIGVAVRASGSPVGGLHAEDFLVLDNGVPQKVESIESEAIPADVTVLVETSEGVKDYLGSVNSQLQKILAQLRPDDRLRVLGIDTYVTELMPLQRAGDHPVIGKLPLGGLASVHDALAAGLLLASDPQRRQMVFVVSDTIDSISTLTAETVRDLARQSPAELHIAWVTLVEVAPPKMYVSTPEREPHATGNGSMEGQARRRFWVPYSQKGPFRMTHDFAAIIEAAELTGGKAYLPGIFTNWTASSIFSRIYDDYRHSYVLRFSPQGVKREGRHELSVTLPKYPNVEITARRGYSIDAPAPVSPAPASETTAPSYETVADRIRRNPDRAKAIKDFVAAGNPWPAAPNQEAVLALELADAAFRSGRDDARQSAANLLGTERWLVQKPIKPDEFERLWLWTALASFQAMVRPVLAEPFVASALKRMPNEPRLRLGRAILADQEAPVGTVDKPDAAAAAHVKDVGAMYDEAMVSPDTAPEARVRKAWLLHRNGQHAEALALLDAATPRATDDVLVFWRDLFRAQVLDATGRGTDAIASYRAALALFPRSQSANVGLMNALARGGGRAEAKAIAEQIQALRVSDEDPYWLYWSGDYRFVPAAMTRLRELAGVK